MGPRHVPRESSSTPSCLRRRCFLTVEMCTACAGRWQSVARWAAREAIGRLRPPSDPQGGGRREGALEAGHWCARTDGEEARGGGRGGPRAHAADVVLYALQRPQESRRCAPPIHFPMCVRWHAMTRRGVLFSGRRRSARRRAQTGAVQSFRCGKRICLLENVSLKTRGKTWRAACFWQTSRRSTKSKPTPKPRMGAWKLHGAVERPCA